MTTTKRINKIQLNWWQQLIVITIALIIIGYFLSPYALLGIIILILGFVLYRLYKHRGVFKTGIRDMESKIWGKSLDKTNWQKNEMKNLKVKIGWDSKNSKKKDSRKET